MTPAAAWDSTVTYTPGQRASYNGKDYAALDSSYANLDKQPDKSPSFWGLVPPRDQQDPRVTEALEAIRPAWTDF